MRQPHYELINNPMKEQRNKFKLSKVNWIIALVIVVISGFIFLKSDGVNAYSLGILIGSIVVIGLVPLLLSILVWFIRGKKKFAGTYTFNIVLFFMTLGMIIEMVQLSRDKSNGLNAISTSVSELKDEINATGARVSAIAKYTANVDDALTNMIALSTGNEQKVYVKLREFNQTNIGVLLDWQRSYDSVMEPRILNYEVLKAPSEFEYQISVLEHYKAKSNNYLNHFEKRKPLLVTLFKDIPQENQTLKGIMREVNKQDSIQSPNFYPWIKSHLSYSENLIRLLNLLEKNNMNWTYENEKLIFNNTELENRYLEIIGNIADDEKNINVFADKLMM